MIQEVTYKGEIEELTNKFNIECKQKKLPYYIGRSGGGFNSLKIYKSILLIFRTKVADFTLPRTSMELDGTRTESPFIIYDMKGKDFAKLKHILQDLKFKFVIRIKNGEIPPAYETLNEIERGNENEI